MSRRTTCILMAGLALLMTGVIVLSVQMREQTISGCLRGTADRAANADGWRTAETARRASAAKGGPTKATDLVAAERYDRIAAALESRTRPTQPGRDAFCADAFDSHIPFL